MKILSKKKRGFTLIEMTIVLFIISLLILIIVPNMSHARDSANDIHKNAMISVVQSQIDSYLDDHPEKGNDQVSYDELTGNNYLTPKQKKKADDEHITINASNHAVENNDSGVTNPKAKSQNKS